MLHVTVLVAALLGQTIYTWTDKNGEEHFTDDPSSIPRGVKAKTMAPGEVETVLSSDEPAPPKPAAQPPPKPVVIVAEGDAGVPAPVDTCAQAREALRQAEAELAEARRPSPPPRDCQSVLNTLGQGAYAQCMANQAEAREGERKTAKAQRRVDSAKDDLRRAQAAGCR
ncbi:MAG: DUF4124 domain-containing protein [Myxococcota bacterium]